MTLQQAPITVTKIVDIDVTVIPHTLLMSLKENADYRDQVLKEHLYGMSTLEDYLQDNPNHHEEVNYLIQVLMDQEAAYIRFISK